MREKPLEATAKASQRYSSAQTQLRWNEVGVESTTLITRWQELKCSLILADRVR